MFGINFKPEFPLRHLLYLCPSNEMFGPCWLMQPSCSWLLLTLRALPPLRGPGKAALRPAPGREAPALWSWLSHKLPALQAPPTTKSLEHSLAQPDTPACGLVLHMGFHAYEPLTQQPLGGWGRLIYTYYAHDKGILTSRINLFFLWPYL